MFTSTYLKKKKMLSFLESNWVDDFRERGLKATVFDLFYCKRRLPIMISSISSIQDLWIGLFAPQTLIVIMWRRCCDQKFQKVHFGAQKQSYFEDKLTSNFFTKSLKLLKLQPRAEKLEPVKRIQMGVKL
jgi:hypothetical protein